MWLKIFNLAVIHRGLKYSLSVPVTALMCWFLLEPVGKWHFQKTPCGNILFSVQYLGRWTICKWFQVFNGRNAAGRDTVTRSVWHEQLDNGRGCRILTTSCLWLRLWRPFSVSLCLRWKSICFVCIFFWINSQRRERAELFLEMMLEAERGVAERCSDFRSCDSDLH